MSWAINVGGAPAGLEQTFSPPAAQWEFFPFVAAPVLMLPASGAATYTYAASGGLQLGGAAALSKSVSVSGAGGLQLGGAALLAKTTSPVASGGLNLGGAVAVSFVKVALGEGGLQLAGEAPVAKSITYAGAGGVQYAGAAVAQLQPAGEVFEYTASGGLSFSGEALCGCYAGAGTPIVCGGVSPVLVARLRAAERRERRKEHREDDEAAVPPPIPRPGGRVFAYAGAGARRRSAGRAQCGYRLSPREDEDELQMVFRKAA